MEKCFPTEGYNESFGRLRGTGKLDYVCAWFEKAADYSSEHPIRSAFVAAKSICQGEFVGILWKRLANKGIAIDFAYRPFVWNSVAEDGVHAHVVVVGLLHDCDGRATRTLFDEDGNATETDHINGYLYTAPDVFIGNRGRPVNVGAPEMTKGSQPTDGGNLILSGKERATLLARQPELDEVIRPYVGGREFLNGGDRWCLWFADADISKFASPEIAERLRAVLEARSASPTESVRAAASIPCLFTQIRQPETDYLALPEASSQRREYLSVGYMRQTAIASNKLRFVPSDDLYIFCLLSSKVHAAWMRVVSGRLKSDYSYSPAVCNSLVFPKATEKERDKIRTAARQAIEARKLYGEKTLAEPYDPDKAAFYPELAEEG